MAYRPKNSVRTAAAVERLQRIAHVLVAPLRIRIMAALSVRPMSPKMFQEEFGGGDLSRIDENFKVLRHHGWVSLVDTRTGGKRRSATEHIYRATQLPVFDDEAWAALPLPMREMVSWNIAQTFTGRLGEAIEAGTMDGRDDRHFTWMAGLVDLVGWKRIVSRANSVFEFFVDARRRSAGRLAKSGEEPIPTTVGLVVFESPSKRFDLDRRPQRVAQGDASPSSAHGFHVRMAKVMIDPLRMTILAELGTRAMSAKGFFEEFGGGEITKARVYRAFRTLKRFDWIVLVEKKSTEGQRGGKEHFYRAARPPVLDSSTWPALPESMKEVVSGKIYDTLTERLGEAIEAGTMDARDDRHFTWTPGLVDRVGWNAVIERVDDLFRLCCEEIERAEGELEKSGEEGIPLTVALAAFESPMASVREP